MFLSDYDCWRDSEMIIIVNNVNGSFVKMLEIHRNDDNLNVQNEVVESNLSAQLEQIASTIT